MITLEGLPWFKDGLSQIERLVVVNRLRRITRVDLAAAQTILGFPWIEDGIDHYEMITIIAVSAWVEANPTISRAVMAFPWFADGISRQEESLIRAILAISEMSPSFAQEVLDMPWLADGVGKFELGAIVGIRSLAPWNYPDQDSSLLRRVLSLPWITDGISQEEGRKLALLAACPVVDWEKPQYRGVDALLSLDPANDSLDEGAFLALEELIFFGGRLGRSGIKISQFPDELLGSQSWFRDGLSKDEKALIISLNSIMTSCNLADALRILEQVINHGQVLTETISSASTGEINFYVVSRSPLSTEEDIFEKLRSRIRSEGTSAKNPSSVINVVLLVDPELRTCAPGIQVGTVIDEQISRSKIFQPKVKDAIEEFYSDLTASVQTVYPAEIYETAGGVPVASALAPLGESLRWAPTFDNVTKRRLVYDPRNLAGKWAEPGERLYLGTSSIARDSSAGRAVGSEGPLGGGPVVPGPRG